MLWLILTLVGFLLMVGLENPGAEVYSSQLQLQFAWTPEQALAVLTSWGEAGRARVIHGLYADYLFLLGYSLLLRRWLLDAGSSHWLIRGVVLAGALDALENLVLLGFIQGGVNLAFTLPVSLLATLKFSLIGAALANLGYRLGGRICCQISRRVNKR